LDIERILQTGETQSVEFKKSLSQRKEGCKTLCGMLNAKVDAGMVLFGISPENEVVGIGGNLDSTQRSLVQHIQQKYDPSIKVSIQIEEYEDKKILILSAKRSNDVCYYEYDGRAFFREGSTTRCLSIQEKQSLNNRMLDETKYLELAEIKARNNLTSLADKAVSQGSREAYLNLKQIVENFGPNRNAAISEISKIVSHWNFITTLKGIKLPEKKLSDGTIGKELDYTTKELIEILLFNSQSLFRGRSAQLLASRKENYVPEALILAIFSDKHLEVVREATLAFGKVTNFQSPDFFQPYNVWGYWLDNSERIRKNLIQSNNIKIIQLKKFIKKLEKNIESNKYEYMYQLWATSIDIAKKYIFEFLKEKKDL